MAGGLFVGWRGWLGRRCEFGVVNRDVLFYVIDLDGEAVAWAGEGPAIGDFYAVGVSVIGVIDLCGHAAEGGFGVTHEAKKQAGLLVEIEAQGRLAFVAAENKIGVAAIDFFAGDNGEFLEESFDVGGEIEIGVDARGVVFGCGHHVWMAGVAEPTLLAVEGGNAVAIGEMHGGDALVGSFGENFDGKLMAVGVNFAFFDAAGDLLQGRCAADG